MVSRSAAGSCRSCCPRGGRPARVSPSAEEELRRSRYLKQLAAAWCRVSARHHNASKITWTCPTETVRGQKHDKNNLPGRGRGLNWAKNCSCPSVEAAVDVRPPNISQRCFLLPARRKQQTDFGSKT
ncbi:hypothetical protein PAMP_016090 [Pampus punctatissimus]